MVQKVLVTEMAKYNDNKALKKEILNSFPKKIENTLYAYRQKIIGTLPGIFSILPVDPVLLDNYCQEIVMISTPVEFLER